MLLYNQMESVLLGSGISPLTIEQFARFGPLQSDFSLTNLVGKRLEHRVPKANWTIRN